MKKLIAIFLFLNSCSISYNLNCDVQAGTTTISGDNFLPKSLKAVLDSVVKKYPVGAGVLRLELDTVETVKSLDNGGSEVTMAVGMPGKIIFKKSTLGENPKGFIDVVAHELFHTLSEDSSKAVKPFQLEANVLVDSINGLSLCVIINNNTRSRFTKIEEASAEAIAQHYFKGYSTSSPS